MDSSSSDEEKAKDKGEEVANLYYNSVCDPSLSGLLFKYLLTHFPWSDLAAKGTLDQTQTNKLLNECQNLNSDYKAKVMGTLFFQVFFF